MSEGRVTQGLQTVPQVEQAHSTKFLIAVCDAESAEKCPIFPGPTTRLHWSFPDPSKVTGKYEQKLQLVRDIRDEIAAKIQDWLASLPVEQPA